MFTYIICSMAPSLWAFLKTPVVRICKINVLQTFTYCFCFLKKGDQIDWQTTFLVHFCPAPVFYIGTGFLHRRRWTRNQLQAEKVGFHRVGR